MPFWFHTFALNGAEGIYTPGAARDHRYRVSTLPDDFGGISVLDVGTFDGFYAFLAEHRGADRVVAVDNEQYRLWVASRWDVELRGGEGFGAIQRLLGSAAEMRAPARLALRARLPGRQPAGRELPLRTVLAPRALGRRGGPRGARGRAGAALRRWSRHGGPRAGPQGGGGQRHGRRRALLRRRGRGAARAGAAASAGDRGRDAHRQLQRRRTGRALYRREPLAAARGRRPGRGAARPPRRRADARRGRAVILLWGVPGDSPLDAVLAALRRRGAPTLLVDQRRPADVALELEVGERLAGSLRVGEERVELEAIAGLYLRPQDLGAARASPDGTRVEAARIGAALDDTLLALAELAPALVLNRPEAMAANGSKPYQYAQIAAAGFAVPDTLITTSADAAREFAAQQGRVVYKSISGVRSIVAELGPEDEARLEDVAWCPTQFQRWIAGIDVRVHVVGQQLFACEVRSEAIDYRYAPRTGQGVELSPCELPGDCAERCLGLARASELTLAGIDLRRTPEGEWYCFEINPSPGFTYYEEATGEPIAAAVAELLMQAER